MQVGLSMWAWTGLGRFSRIGRRAPLGQSTHTCNFSHPTVWGKLEELGQVPGALRRGLGATAMQTTRELLTRNDAPGWSVKSATLGKKQD